MASPSFQFVIFVHSIFFILAFILLASAVKPLGANLSVIALLFFFNPYLYLIHLTAIRQSIAISVFVIFISLYLKYRIKFLLFFGALLPMSFHKAGLIYILITPIIFVSRRVYLLRNSTKIFFSITLLVFFYIILYEFRLPGILSKFQFYLDNLPRGNISISTLLYFIFISVLFFTSSPARSLGEQQLEIYTVLHLIVLMSLVLTAFSLYFNMFSRVTLFIDFFIPFYFACSKYPINRRIAFALLTCIYFIRNFTFLNTDIYYNGFSVYKSVL